MSDEKKRQPKRGRADIPRSSAAEYLSFVAASGEGGVEAIYADEGVWLSQKMMAVLYNVEVPTINYHLKKIFADGELDSRATVRGLLRVQREGTREVSRSVEHYNLKVIIAVGYKVNSERAVQFRKWATEVVDGYTIQGWAIDVIRLSSGHRFSVAYFKRQLELVCDIRASERRFYPQITGIYATAFDYDPTAQTAREFFALKHHKSHGAAHRHTASELIVERADADQHHMGLKGEESCESHR